MEVDHDATSTTPKKKVEKTDSSNEESPDKKSDRKSDTEDPKPRIVLTFRSEKGAKSTAMKIVPTEEKHEEMSLRRSSRAKPKCDYRDYTNYRELSEAQLEVQAAVEASEATESSPVKRSTRRRSKEFDNVIANAIARKEKSYNETPATTRPSRRIKPTAKVLANEEMRIETQTRQDKSPEEGVRTRRSARSGQRNINDNSAATEQPKGGGNGSQVMKLKHLCELGLQAWSPSNSQDSPSKEEKDAEEPEPIEIEDELEEEEEVDDDTEVISKLLEDDSTSDSDYSMSSQERPKRTSSYNYDSDFSIGERSTAPRRRSSRKKRRRSLSTETKSKRNRTAPVVLEDSSQEPENQEDVGEVAGGEAGEEAACPDDSPPIATCFCQTPSNVFAAPEQLTEPVFCQAISTVDGIRVGCSVRARRSSGSYCAMVRAGPRAPYFLACDQHAQQLHNHMCCPACGLFCHQGTFYRCSLGHLFHLECGVPYNENGPRPGCPHCGVRSYRWLPVNTDCVKVKVLMNSENKTVFLPDQREQCTPAFLGFSKTKPPEDVGPVIPTDLLPCPPIDLKKMCQVPPELAEDLDTSPGERLYDAIVAGETVEQLIPKIMSDVNLNKPVPSMGGTFLHVAARRGNLAAVYALHCAGALLDVYDSANRTPLIAAVSALLEKPENKSSKKTKSSKEPAEDNAEDETKEGEDSEKEDLEGDIKVEDDKAESEIKASDEEYMKVIRYLIAAGCDLNLPGPDGMTALHIACQYGSCDVVECLLLGGAKVEPKDHGGWTPLVWAAENDHHEVVRLLLREGAEAMTSDSEGNMAVHWCALSGAARALAAILHAAPHAAHALNTHHDTPLHIAARQGHYACVVILLARGARTDVENSGCELPVEVCTGPCQTAISLTMQMALVRHDRDAPAQVKLLSSDISRGREAMPIPCINEVDDTPLPEDFTYVTSHVMPNNILIDNSVQSLQGCSCKDGDCSGGGCECCVLGVRGWWRRAHPPLPAALLHHFPYHDPPMLFECNATCACNYKKCTNNVLTRLTRHSSVFVRAEVYRVGGARGWGLRASAPVPHGAPVATYVGELITLADADQRSADQYMFALDIKPDLLEQCTEKEALCVDAMEWGGGARFMNHSCRPNTAPVRLFTATRDLRLPHVALFATRDIKAGEELTFDYGDKFWSVKCKWMRCECGAPDCRYSTIKQDNKT